VRHSHDHVICSQCEFDKSAGMPIWTPEQSDGARRASARDGASQSRRVRHFDDVMFIGRITQVAALTLPRVLTLLLLSSWLAPACISS